MRYPWDTKQHITQQLTMWKLHSFFTSASAAIFAVRVERHQGKPLENGNSNLM